MLSVKQRGIKYLFLSLWYDSSWDWTLVSRAMGEYFNGWAYENIFLNQFYSQILHHDLEGEKI